MVCVDVGGNADERDYTCECRAPDTNEPYAELTQESRIEDCRNRVTEVCEKGQTASSYAFCTNGGLCVEEVEEGEDVKDVGGVADVEEVEDAADVGDVEDVEGVDDVAVYGGAPMRDIASSSTVRVDPETAVCSSTPSAR